MIFTLIKHKIVGEKKRIQEIKEYFKIITNKKLKISWKYNYNSKCFL